MDTLFGMDDPVGANGEGMWSLVDSWNKKRGPELELVVEDKRIYSYLKTTKQILMFICKCVTAIGNKRFDQFAKLSKYLHSGSIVQNLDRVQCSIWGIAGPTW